MHCQVRSVFDHKCLYTSHQYHGENELTHSPVLKGLRNAFRDRVFLLFVPLLGMHVVHHVCLRLGPGSLVVGDWSCKTFNFVSSSIIIGMLMPKRFTTCLGIDIPLLCNPRLGCDLGERGCSGLFL